MQANERKINNVLTEGLCYRIPPYQRPYSWTDEHASQLFADIKASWEDNADEYFIGSLITIKKIDEKRNVFFEVVDGQQRLTTLSIILARMRDRLPKDSEDYHILSGRLLPPKAQKKGLPPRLTLRSEDQSFFHSHILESKPFTKDITTLNAPQRHLIANAHKIDEMLSKFDEKQISDLAEFIAEKVSVVFVFTETFDSAYRLFNVLNARGLSLSGADLIKGEFFRRGEDENIDGSRINSLWGEIEREVTIDGLDAFLSHHWTSLSAKKMSRNLHQEFTPLINGSNPVKLLESMIESVSNYERIAPSSFRSTSTQKRVHSLERMKHKDWIPPLLAFFNKPVSDLSEDVFIDMLERITMQNWVLRLASSARLTVYHNLISAINAGKNASDIRDIFFKHANNDHFFRSLGETFYGEQYAKSILLYLESSTDEDDMVSKTFSDIGISIEHVLPQNMGNEYWKKHFTSEQHLQWLNKIGNLTLISGRMNSSAKNYAFDKKKAIFSEKARKTSFDLTKEICSHQDWTLKIIETRHNDLLNKAMKLWGISVDMV